MGRERGPNCRRKNGFLLMIINKTNKNNSIGEKQTGKQARLDKARQGRTQGIHSIQHKMANQHQTCKHKEILKGENEEGNEG